jgi:serine/threonine-protein kinase RsbT
VSDCSGAPFCESFPVTGGNFDDAGLVSGRIKSVLKDMGFTSDVLRKTAIIAYEAEINIVSYARQGKITLQILPGHVAIEVEDEGPGITDIRVAMQQGWSTANEKIREMGFGAGMGLHNIRSFADIFHLSSEVGIGTRLKMIVHTHGDPNG